MYYVFGGDNMLIPYKNNLVLVKGNNIQYLTDDELNRFIEAWMTWYDSKDKYVRRKDRGRYWLTFLTLRYTGARHGEVAKINDIMDVDFRNYEIRIRTLKQKKQQYRIVPVLAELISEIARYIAEYPDMKGKVFALNQDNFRKKYYEISAQARIDSDRSHPHILRHTRAIELLRAGVPVTIVQNLLGHSALTTTAMYLRFSNAEAKQILREKGLI